ncbi:MAG TPA: MASE1 domain-containing protein [Tepidisphaeraceae bacterium]|jgi:PAS domain S-box-containing protein
MQSGVVKHLALGAGLSVLYLWAGTLGLKMASLNPSVSPVWPPTGLALAAMLLLGVRYWPAVFIAAVLLNMAQSGHWPSSLGIATGNTLEAVLGAMLARRFARGTQCFDQPGDILRFVFLAVNPSTALAATIGVTSLWLGHLIPSERLAPAWLTWWLSGFVSNLVVAPMLILWLRRPTPRLEPSQRLEAASLILALLGVGLLVFGRANFIAGKAYPLGFLMLPPMLWAVLRFGQRGAILSVVMVSGIAVWCTLNRMGPYAIDSNNDALLLLQAFIGVNSLTMLVLAAVARQHSSALASLNDNEQRLWMALEAGQMGTWEWEIPTGHVRWSRGLEQIHGLAPGQFAGTFQAFLDDVHPEDRARVQEQVARTLQERRDHHIEYRLLPKDGRMRWVEGRGQLVLTSSGEPIRMVGVCTDITERKIGLEERERLLERERNARAEAERANRSKDDFLAVLSHELRTPLTPVLITASMLETDKTLTPRIRTDLQTIRRNVEMEARLIDDLLDLTRIGRGKLKLELQVTDLHEIVRRAIDICCRDAEMRIVVELQAQRHHIHGDAGRIQQVFCNLLNNARKFTPPGGTITVRSGNPQPVTVSIDVTDTGVGIAPEKMSRLFHAFEQGDTPRARRAGGLGLGLAISKALITAHRGMLSAASPGVGQGATFCVQLAAVEVPAEAGVGRSPTPLNSAAAGNRPMRILLVEDDASTLEAMRRLLEAIGHDVVDATSVASAIEAAAREPIDLVISDLGLPDGLGYELMRTVADKYGVQGIALSGYGMAGDIRQSREAGFAEHLTKPIDMDTLEAAIARVASSVAAAASSTARAG